MKNIILMLAVFAAVAVGWTYRYQPIGVMRFGTVAYPLVLNRWTGTVYIAYPSGLETCAQNKGASIADQICNLR